MILVLDTNVFVSAMRGRDRAPHELFTLWKNREIDLAFSPQMLIELKRVFTYPKVQKLLGDVAPKVEMELDHLQRIAILTSGTVHVDVIQDDASDNMVLACAKEAHADMIVSGDTKHVLPLRQFEGIPILSPAEAVRVLRRLKQRAA